MAVIHDRRGAPAEPTLDAPITADEIRDKLALVGGWGSVMVPEFTWGDLRADAIVLDVKKRWIRGFEIKVSRSDFLQDDKWHLYSQFCSSLSLACPHGLIKPEEIPAPFGLVYFKRVGGFIGLEITWAKKPKRFQRRDSLAWLWTYLKVLETELPRAMAERAAANAGSSVKDNEIRHLREQVNRYMEAAKAAPRQNSGRQKKA